MSTRALIAVFFALTLLILLPPSGPLSMWLPEAADWLQMTSPVQVDHETALGELRRVGRLITVEQRFEHRFRYSDWYVIRVGGTPYVLPGSRRTLIVGAAGTVTAAVDVAGLREDALRVDGSQARVRLPPAEIEAVTLEEGPTIDVAERGLLRRLTGDDLADRVPELWRLVRRDVIDEAVRRGILDEASDHGRDIVTDMLQRLGFTDVDVVVTDF